MKLTNLSKVSILVILLTSVACTKLDERELLFDTITTDNFYKTDAELASAVGAAYAPLRGIGGNGHLFSLQEVTSDEIVVPQRGADWGDGGHWIRLKQHTYKFDDPMINNGWNFGFTGVTTCNKLLVVLESVEQSPQVEAYKSELKALRAIYYYWLLDLYGNVPITTDFTVTDPPPTKSRAEVYAFIEQELLSNADILPKSGPADGPNYGRVNYYTAWAALAKLYLNAQVYTGTAQWDKAIDACDKVINGPYSLASNYIDNFKRDNIGSPEFIWAIPYHFTKYTGFNIPMMTLSYLNQDTYKINAQPWNGFASVQEFYQSYIDPVQNPGPQGTVVGLDPLGTPIQGTLDKRLSNFIVGPQYAADGTTRLVDGGADLTDPDGTPLTFTPYINELQPNAWRQSGARIGKWQFYTGMTADLDNDFAIFRLADIILMKAEATARKNNNWGDPVTVALTNQVRTLHGGVDPLPTYTAQTFLAERGREMFAETWRRQDMIRFGTYNSAFRFHAADPSPHVNIFPIPQNQLNSNPNLQQNPGY